jgi:flavodoxin
MGKFGLVASGSGSGIMAGFCEHGNELSGCIKDREFLD